MKILILLTKLVLFALLSCYPVLVQSLFGQSLRAEANFRNAYFFSLTGEPSGFWEGNIEIGTRNLPLSHFPSFFSARVLEGQALGFVAHQAANLSFELRAPSQVPLFDKIKVFKKGGNLPSEWSEISQAELRPSIFPDAIFLNINGLERQDSIIVIILTQPSVQNNAGRAVTCSFKAFWESPSPILRSKRNQALVPFTPTNTSLAAAECVSDKVYNNSGYLCAPACNWPVNKGCWTVTDNVLFYKINITNVPSNLSITNINCDQTTDFLQVAIYPANNPQSASPIGNPFCSSVTLSLIQNNKINGQDTVMTPGEYIIAIDGSSGGSCSFKFNGSAINPLQIVGPDSTVCGKPIQFTSNIKGPYTYTWAGPAGATSNTDTLKINAPGPAHAGIYTLTIKFPNGCQIQKTRQLKVSTPPQAPTVTSNSQVPCGNPVCFTVNMPSGYAPPQYLWQASGWSSTLKEPCRQGGANLAGVYTLNVTYAPGCVATVTHTVTVTQNFTPLPTAEHNYQNCDQTQLCFTVNGVTGPATYKITGPGATPCSPSWSSQPSASNIICRNQVVLGTYSIEVTLANGCKATITRTPNLTPPNYSIPDGSCGPNTTLTFNVSYTNPDANHSWCGPGGWQSTANNPSIGPPVVYGTYCLQYTLKNCIVNYCKNISQLQPTINVNADPINCGQDLVLTASGIADATYTWSGPNNWTATGSTVTRTKPTTGGTYTVVAENSSGTCSRTVTLKNPVIPNPTINVAGNFCSATLSFSVSPTNYDSLKWSGPAGFTSTQFNPQIPNANTGQNGQYTVEAFMGHCKVTRHKTVTVEPLPLPEVLISPSLCEGETLAFQATNLLAGATYSWVKGTDTVAKTPSFNIFPAKFSDNGVYTIVVEKSNCVRTQDFLVEVKPTPKAPAWIISNAPICEGQNLLITSSKEDGATDYIWQGPGNWQSVTQNDTTSTIHNSRANLALSHAGLYSLAVQVNGCTSKFSTFNVVVNPNPLPPLASNVNRCGSGPVTFSAQINGTVPYGAVSLYTEPTGGVAFQTDTDAPFELVSPTISEQTTFYLESYVTSTGCYSSTRTPVVGNVLVIPGQPSAQSITQCAGASAVTFTALMGTPPGTTIHLFTSATAQTPIFSDNSSPFFLTFPITNVDQITTSTLYIQAENSGCFSTLANFNLTLIPSPASPKVEPAERCGDGKVTFTAQFGAPPGNVIRMFTIPCQNSAIDSSLIDNGTIETSILTGGLNLVTYTYYFQAVDQVNGCKSPCISSTAIIHPIPPAPSVQNVSRCGIGELTLTVMASPLVSTIELYSQPTGGNPIVTLNPSPFLYTTPVLSQSVTYFAEAITSKGCRSVSRTPGAAIVHPLPGPPIMNNVQRCGPGVVTFTFNNFNTFPHRIYTVPTGGAAIATTQGNSFTVGPLTSTQTFYVERTDPITSCASPRSQVVATIHPIPGLPLVEPISKCEAGQLTFTARMGNPIGSRIRMYTSSTAASPLQSQSGATGQFPVLINSTSTYYFNVIDDNTGCEGERTAAVASIFPNPNLPTTATFTRCGSGALTITANLPGAIGGDKLIVYSNPELTQVVTETSSFPLSFITPSLSASTVYYLRATNINSGCVGQVAPLSIQILPVPAPPVPTDLVRCGPGNLTLTFTLADALANQVILYPDMQGSIPIKSQDAPPTTLPLGFLQADAVYYISARNKNTTCESSRASFKVTINRIPASPQISVTSTCGPGEAHITLSPISPFADQYTILNEAQQSLATLSGSPWRYTANIVTHTDFWVEASITSTGCKSNLVKVTALVNPIPPLPTIENLQRCGPGSLTFTAQFNLLQGSTLAIYTQPAGGSPLRLITSPPYQFNTPIISNSTTYYASLINQATGCASPRHPLVATIFPVPGAPSAPDSKRCGAGNIVFTATMGNPAGTAIRFYNGNELIDTQVADFIFSAFIETTTLFAIESFDAVTGCRSESVTITGKVDPIPGTPTGTATLSCQSPDVTLRFQMGVPAGNKIELYNQGWELLHTLSSPYQVTLPISLNTTYYAKSFQSQTGCRSPEFTITARPLTYATPTNAPALERCGPGNVIFTLSSTTAGHFYRIYDAPIGGQPRGEASASQPEILILDVTQTQTFYIESFSPQRDCPSPRTPAIVNIYPIVGVPRASGVARCGPGQITITAAMGIPAGTTIALFTQPQDGVFVERLSGGNYAFMAPVSTSVNFYLEAKDEATGCVSPRAKVEVTVFPIPAPPQAPHLQRCGVGPLTFTVTSSRPVYLYSAEGGLLTRDLTEPYWLSLGEIYQSQTYYLEAIDMQTGCKSAPTAVVAEVLPIPPAPVVENGLRCGPGSVTLTVSQNASANASVRLYDQTHNLLAASASPLLFTTPLLYTQTLYFASSFDGNCESEKIPVRAVVAPLPSAPVVRPQTFCSGDIANAVVFTARMGNTPGTGVRMFTQAAGGTAEASSSSGPLYELATYVSGFSTFVYYFEAFDIATGCASARSSASVTINPLPDSPTPVNISRCGPGEVRFSVAPGNFEKMNLYRGLTDITPVQSQMQFPSEFVFTYEAEDAYYFLETENLSTGCKSPRIPIRAVINPLPSPPFPTSNGPVCAGQSLIIQTPPASDIVYEWKGPNGFTATGPTVEFNPATPAQSGLYEVSALSGNGCKSAAGIARVEVIPIPSVPTVTYYRDFLEETPLCEGDELNLSVLNYPDYAEGTQFEWKGPSNFTAFPHPFPGIERPLSVSNSGTYYVRAIFGQCSSAYGSVEVMVHPKPIKPIIQSNAPLCLGGEANLTLSIQNPEAAVVYHWRGPANFLAKGIEHTREPRGEAAGLYTVQAVTDKGCTSEVATHTVSIYQEPLNAIPSFTPTVCEGGVIEIEIPHNRADAVYEWVMPDGTSIVNNRNKFTVLDVTLNHAGLYQVRVKQNGCFTPFAQMQIEVVRRPPTPVIMGPTRVCQRERAIFSASSSAEGVLLWQVPGLLPEVEASALALNSSQLGIPGVFNVQAQIRNALGCKSEVAMQTFEVLPQPVAPFLLRSAPVCKGDTVAVGVSNPNPAATYLWQSNIPNWTGGNGASVTFVAPEAMASVILSVRAVVEGCASLHSSIVVEVKPTPPVPQIPLQYSICLGSGITFTAQVSGFEYLLWQGPAQLSAVTRNLNWEVSSPIAGEYQVWSVLNGCTSAASKTIVSMRTVTAPAMISPHSFCEGQPLWLTASNDTWVEQYIWRKPNGAETVTTENSIFIGNAHPNIAGVYAMAVVANGCTSSFAPHSVSVIPNPPAPSINVNSSSVCVGNMLRLTAQTSSANAEFRWSGPGGFTSTQRSPQILFTGTQNGGIYELYTIVGQCTSRGATILVNVSERPEAPQAIANAPICQGQTLNLRASHPKQALSQFYWRGPNNFEQGGQVVSLSNLQVQNAGVYSVVAIIEGCASLPGIVSVDVKEAPALVDLVNNGPLCAGENLNLVTQLIPGARYIWYGPEWGPVASATANYSLPSSLVKGGDYYVYAVAAGCTSRVLSTRVEVGTKPPTPSVRTNAPVCSGQGLVLMASTLPNVRYYWQGPGASEFDPTQQNPVITNAQTFHSGTYSVVAIQGACTSNAASVAAQVNETPAPAQAFTNAPICAGQSLRLTAIGPPGVTYNWTGPSTGEGGNFSSNVQNPVIANASTAQAGTYNVTTTKNGCTSAPASLIAEVKPRPITPFVGPIPPLCQGQTLELNTAVIPGYQYFWSGPAGFTSTSPLNTISGVTMANAGGYSLVTIFEGCSSNMVIQNVAIIPAPYDFSSEVVNWCVGQIGQLSAPQAAGYRFTWTGPAGFMSNQSTVTIPSVSARNQGAYQLFAEINNCRFALKRVEAYVQNCSRVGQADNIMALPTVYPNPSSGLFHLSFQLGTNALVANPVKIQVVSLEGRLVLEDSFNSLAEGGEIILDLSAYPAGTYLLNCRIEEQLYTIKIFKQ